MTTRTQKQLIEDVQQSEKIGEAIANFVIAIDTGSRTHGLKEQAALLQTIFSETHFLKNEQIEEEAS